MPRVQVLPRVRLVEVEVFGVTMMVADAAAGMREVAEGLGGGGGGFAFEFEGAAGEGEGGNGIEEIGGSGEGGEVEQEFSGVDGGGAGVGGGGC